MHVFKRSEQEMCPVLKSKTLAIVLSLFLALRGAPAPSGPGASSSFWATMYQHRIFSELAGHKMLVSNNLGVLQEVVLLLPLRSVLPF